MKKKAEAKHTPTPWKATMVLVSGRGKQSIFRPWITTTDGDRGICEIFVSGNDGRNITSEDRANAAFIVRAVNAFDDLLEALKTLLDAVKNNPTMNKREFVDMGIMVNNAIAKAEGGER